MPYKSHPHTSKTPVGRKNVQYETTGLHKSPQRRQIVRSSRNRRRRRRRKSSTSLRKGTPRKSIPEPDHSGPEVELVDIEDQRDVEDANGTIDNRQQTGNEMYGNEEGEMSVDEKNDDAPENAELEEREESNGNVAALKSKRLVWRLEFSYGWRNFEYLTTIHRSGGKYLRYLPTLRWTIVLAYTSHICVHIDSI